MALPTLSPHQEDAAKAIKKWYDSNPVAQDFFYLGGVAGSGKSTCLGVFIDNLCLNFEDVTWVSPTGKAAKVMADKLKAFGIESSCRTIHSVIYRPKGLIVSALLAEERRLQKELDEIQNEWRDPDDNQKSPAVIQIRQSLKIVNIDIERALSEDKDGPRFQ